MRRLLAFIGILSLLFSAYYVAFERADCLGDLTSGGYEDSMAQATGRVIEKNPNNHTIVLDTDFGDGSVGEIRLDMGPDDERSPFGSIEVGDYLRVNYLRTVLPSGGYEFMGLEELRSRNSGFK
mgnify:FL=1